MKKMLTALTMTCLLTAWAVCAQEQPRRGPGGPGIGPAGRGLGMMGLPPQVMEKLGLTDEQKQKAMELGQKYRPQLEEIMKKMREEFRAILTDDQKKKLDEAVEETRQRFSQGRGGAEKGAGRGKGRPDAEK
ncbi:MAG: hypothetical protein N2689_08885 [Verrucomicrobiae bacterium]|nr:hypothetical protein [Verrucomicrobiae bacterium]